MKENHIQISIYDDLFQFSGELSEHGYTKLTRSNSVLCMELYGGQTIYYDIREVARRTCKLSLLNVVDCCKSIYIQVFDCIISRGRVCIAKSLASTGARFPLCYFERHLPSVFFSSILSAIH